MLTSSVLVNVLVIVLVMKPGLITLVVETIVEMLLAGVCAYSSTVSESKTTVATTKNTSRAFLASMRGAHWLAFH